MNITGKSFWKDHFTAWKASELTQEAYCLQTGISYQSFVYQHNRTNRKSKDGKPNFIAVKTEHPIHQDKGLQLFLPNGIRIGICNDVNENLLQRVLVIAKGIPC